MKIQSLRKVYPYINNKIKTKHWRKVTDADLDSLMQEKQVISNCYDVAVRYALLLTEKGREAIKKVLRIATDENGNLTSKITFHIKEKKKTYRSVTSDSRTLGESIGSAVGKMIRFNPSEKPLISRLGRFGFARFQEFNKPSNAFHWYTGKTAIAIGEDTLRPNLKKERNSVIELLNNIADSKEKKPFVVISNHKQSKLNGQRRWHCLPILHVDKEKKQLQIINKRTDEIINLSFDELINNFKAIVGLTD